MYPFIYHRPTYVAEAKRLFKAGTDATFISGGHTLLPALKQRLAAPSDVVDLWGMAELQGIAVSGDRVTIGGGMVHSAVAESRIVCEHIPVLAGLAGSIGDRHVRHRGTIGGSVANNDPAADYPSAVLALDGTIITDQRRVAADSFFSGLYETAREPGEIVTAIEFPVPLSAGYAKFRNAASRYALAAVFVAKTRSGVRVAVTGAGASGVFRPTAFEVALDADFRPEALDDLAINPDALLSDTAATGAYRANLVKVLARRAVARQGVVQIFK
jgi:aerobic carbon-monoxide dehydrogenase medium subunit